MDGNGGECWFSKPNIPDCIEWFALG
jgi:hypothetical protein